MWNSWWTDYAIEHELWADDSFMIAHKTFVNIKVERNAKLLVHFWFGRVGVEKIIGTDVMLDLSGGVSLDSKWLMNMPVEWFFHSFRIQN